MAGEHGTGRRERGEVDHRGKRHDGLGHMKSEYLGKFGKERKVRKGYRWDGELSTFVHISKRGPSAHLGEREHRLVFYTHFPPFTLDNHL